MVEKTLKGIAEIYTGYSFREAIKGDLSGQTAALQVNSLDSLSLMVDVSKFKTISEAPKNSGAYVQSDDVVISVRSSLFGNFKSAVFKGFKKPVIASSSLYIIRPSKDSLILPEYLSLYLNSEIAQKVISQKSTIATVKTISRSDLGNLKISIPSLQEQKIIIDVYKNTLKQERLLEKKIDINKKIIKGVLQSIMI